MSSDPLRYDQSVERPEDGEAETAAALVKSF
jgi:hypothetical protein